MKFKSFSDALEVVILELKQRYDITVELVDEEVSISDEVAAWKDQKMVVDVNSLGIRGTLTIVCHVFGHLIQFMRADDYSALLNVTSQKPPLDLSSEFKEKYFHFESEVYSFGYGLLEQLGVLNQEITTYFSIFMYTDYEHYWNYLTTGKSGSRQDFDILFKVKQEQYRQGFLDPIKGKTPPNTIKFNTEDAISVV